jgi:hypothetical protein
MLFASSLDFQAALLALRLFCGGVDVLAGN